MSIQTTDRAGVPEWDVTDRLRKALKHAGVSREEIAEELEVSLRLVADILGGHREPKRRELIIWAMRCGVSYEWLAFGTVPDDGPDDGPEGARDQEIALNRCRMQDHRHLSLVDPADPITLPRAS